MRQLRRIIHHLRQYKAARREKRTLQRYRENGYLPWSEGYYLYRDQVIASALASPQVLDAFRRGESLPPGYGWHLDERVVEYPWMITRLSDHPTRLLDAGSTLNLPVVLAHARLKTKKLTIITLAPEPVPVYSWGIQQGISYDFDDLRHAPYRDHWFDEVVCLSTLEHVGLDNQMYGATMDGSLQPDSFLTAAAELLRVTRPGGKLLITVPFGEFQHVYWDSHLFMQQFDSRLLNRLKGCFSGCTLTAEFYQYTPDGWQRSSEANCAACRYFNIHESSDFDPDFAAAARAVACLEVEKPND